jgi:hypothetical protein
LRLASPLAAAAWRAARAAWRAWRRRRGRRAAGGGGDNNTTPRGPDRRRSGRVLPRIAPRAARAARAATAAHVHVYVYVYVDMHDARAAAIRHQPPTTNRRPPGGGRGGLAAHTCPLVESDAVFDVYISGGGGDPNPNSGSGTPLAAALPPPASAVCHLLLLLLLTPRGPWPMSCGSRPNKGRVSSAALELGWRSGAGCSGPGFGGARELSTRRWARKANIAPTALLSELKGWAN